MALPNVAGNDGDMRKNADHLAGLFKRRGFTVETIGGPGSPVVFASLDVPKPAGTLTFYIHYDGQPVDPAGWTRCQPFTPCSHPSGHQPSRTLKFRQPFMAAFIPDVPDASIGRRGVLSHTSQPRVRRRPSAMS